MTIRSKLVLAFFGLCFILMGGVAVDAIRKVTRESVANMGETVNSVRQSTELAATAQTALGEIVSLTRAMADQIGSIAAVARTGSDPSRD